MVGRSKVEAGPAARKSARRVIVGLLLMLALGVSLIAAGLSAWSEGELVITPKSGPTYVLHRVGSTAHDFSIEVGERILAGSFLALLGSFAILGFAFGSPQRRADIVAAAEEAERRYAQRFRLPIWVAVVVVAEVLLFLYAASRFS